MKVIQKSYGIILLITLLSLQGKTQLCQGSLGDPVINITFGSGPNPGNPLPSAGTSYIFNSTTCPNDGFYTIANSTFACFGDSWHTVTQDHTGNASGYFMLVNASIEPSDFYVETITGLCPNTTFEFAAWIMNVLKTSACNFNGIDPNLTFTIETTTGTVLQTYNSGNLFEDAAPTWRQYGFFFKTPQDVTDVVVRIRNNAQGGCGNDLALDDITFRPCGPAVTASISGAGATDNKEICDDDTSTYLLNGVVSAGYDDPAYQWQESINGTVWSDIPGETTTSFARKQTPTGTYYYRLAAAEKGNINSPNCRIVSNIITLQVVGKPVPNATASTPLCEGTALSLSAGNGNTYQWTGPGNYTANGSPATRSNMTLSNAGIYHVLVTTAAGCTQTDSVLVTVIPKPFADAGADASFCEGGSITLNATGGDTYLWQPSTGLSAGNIANPVASPADSIVYTVTVTDNTSTCSDNDTVTINVYRNPTANAGTDKAIVEGDAVQLNASASGTTVNYNWEPNEFISNLTILQPIVNPTADITYTLTVISQLGCGTATDGVFIKVYKKVTVPNAFSPNKDGINDTWRIDAIEAYPDADIRVFNRYGQVVFTTKSNSKFWDGTYNNAELPIGTYYYVIDLKYGLPPLKGWVALLK